MRDSNLRLKRSCDTRYVGMLFLLNLSDVIEDYHISLVIRRIIVLPKQSQGSRSVLKDGSRSLALFRKGKIGIIAKFHRTDIVT